MTAPNDPNASAPQPDPVEDKEQDPLEGIDLDALAREVYRQLRKDLQIERERLARRSNP